MFENKKEEKLRPTSIAPSFIPEITRAKAYRLYTSGGRRLLDLFQNRGHAVLGHRSPKLALSMKNTISRGLIFDLPSIYEKRLIRVLERMFPEYRSFRIYTCDEQIAEAVIALCQGECKDVVPADPALPGWDRENVKLTLWRPFLPQDLDKASRSVPLLIPVLPFSVGGCPRVLCSREPLADDFFPSAAISPFLLAGVVRAVYDLEKCTGKLWIPESRNTAENWFIRGVYITPLFAESLFEKAFHAFLERGILLSPFFPGPSCLPRDVSPGESALLRRLFESDPEKIG